MNRKIIHIALGKANPERPNGVNKVVNSLVTYQHLNGFNVAFWGISFSSKHNYPKRNYSTTLFKDRKNKFGLDKKLKTAIDQLDPAQTIFHIHGGFIPQFYSLSIYLRKKSIPYFFTPHGAYNMRALEKSNFQKRLYIQFFEQFLVNNAHGVQLLGESEKAGTNKYFNAKIKLIPNGQKPFEMQQRTFDSEAIRLGFIGRIDIQTKGLDILLAGVKIACSNTDMKLEIIGAGGEIDSLKQMVQDLGLNDIVEFKGALFGEEKMTAIRSWDALCLLSRNEGLPGVVLEAASVGVPAIVSEATNMKTYIQDYQAGWVLKNNNRYAFSDMLLQLNDAKLNASYDRYSKGARRMTECEFDWNLIAKKIVAAYG